MRSGRMAAPAWVSLGKPAGPHGVRMDGGFALVRGVVWGRQRDAWRAAMQDLIYIGLTVLVFAVLYLLVKGVERLEH